MPSTRSCKRETTTQERTSAFQTSQSDSPVKNSSYSLHPQHTIAKMKTFLEAELSGGVMDITPINDEIYPSYASDNIAQFIVQSSLYDNQSQTWKSVREAEQKKAEKHLYQPLKEVVDLIFQTFPPLEGEDRWVEDTHALRMSHVEGDQLYEETTPEGKKKEVTLKSSPDLSILGLGFHFACSYVKPPQAAYDHCLSPIEIKTVSNYNKNTVLIQAGIYARQCFINQPHRRYVPVVVIVGSDLYLHIYDRSGVLRSDSINIHQDPIAFVRIILGVSTVGTNLHSSPFDPRVCHEFPNDYPTITITNDALNHHAKYKVTQPKFSRKAIRGRGTCCVNAEVNDDGRVVPVLIKEAWRAVKRLPEYDLLDDIKGLDGVGQILWFEDDQPTITDFRKHIFPAFCETDPFELDRRFCRLILQAYGRSIRFFRTKLELLEAIHDAIAGHKYLWKKRILHRDVSVDNILLGLPGAREGNRGILIDFDMAIRVDRTDEPSQFRTGTRAFQSYAVLSSGAWGASAPPQDHLDDLESYFYCLGWICIKYDESPIPRLPEFLKEWEAESATSCANNKLGFLLNPTLNLTSYFDNPIFLELLGDLAKFCRGHVTTKTLTVRKKAFPSLDKVHRSTVNGKHHDKVLKIVKKAIKKQKALPAENPRFVGGSIPFPVSQGTGEISIVARDSGPSTMELRCEERRTNPNWKAQTSHVSVLGNCSNDQSAQNLSLSKNKRRNPDLNDDENGQNSSPKRMRIGRKASGSQRGEKNSRSDC